MYNIIVLASGGGGNFQSIIDHQHDVGFNVNMLISDRICGAIDRAKNHFWQQVRHTINGKAISEDIIKDIVLQIQSNLKLNKNDVLLDLGCGNGVLAHYLFKDIKRYIGVDQSEYLISIAKDNFETIPKFTFYKDNISNFLEKFHNPEKITKILMYGIMQYLTIKENQQWVRIIKLRYPNVQKVFLGAIPDKNKKHTFIKDKNLKDTEISSIGKWRSADEITQLVYKMGYSMQVIEYTGLLNQFNYRFNILLNKII